MKRETLGAETAQAKKFPFSLGEKIAKVEKRHPQGAGGKSLFYEVGT